MMRKMVKFIMEKDSLPDADTHYLPPHILEGQVQGAVLVSEGEVVEKEETSEPDEIPVVQSEEPDVPLEQTMVEGDDAV